MSPNCPDCGTAMTPIGVSREFVCPVALEAQRRGLLGQPGRKHTQVWTYTTSAAGEEAG